MEVTDSLTVKTLAYHVTTRGVGYVSTYALK
jgi:hypothetical protein